MNYLWIKFTLIFYGNCLHSQNSFIMKRVNFVLLTYLAFTFWLSSCSKDSIFENMGEFDDVFIMQKSVLEQETDADEITLKCGPLSTLADLRGKLDPCANITEIGESYPKTLIIDYGTEGCGSDTKHLKKGKVIITISDEITTPQALRTVTFENFSIGKREIKGSRILRNISNDNSVLVFEYEDKIEMIYGKKSILRFASGTKTWSAGYDTPEDKSDDRFELFGTATLSINNSKKISKKILTPLVFEGSCKYPVSGVEQMTDPRKKIHTLNFGDGSCDNEAVLTSSDGSWEIINLDEIRRIRRNRKR